MLIQHVKKYTENGLEIIRKEEVKEVNLGSIAKPSNVVYIEYIGVDKA
jgi:hypothetical protein